MELKYQVHIFSLFVLLYSNTRDAYLFVTMYFIYILVGSCVCNNNIYIPIYIHMFEVSAVLHIFLHGLK